MSDTTADTQRTVQFVGSITTLDEFDGSGYPTLYANKYQIGTENETLDTTDHDRKLSTTEGVLNKTGIGSGTRTVVGFVFYLHATSPADSPLIAFHDLVAAGESFNPDGGAVNTTWDPEGIVKIVAEAT